MTDAAQTGHDRGVEAPPAVVVDAHDVCPDLDRAQQSLREALGASVAPQPGWRLRVFDERRGTHYVVTANLDDAQGNGVAHRVIDATASDRCDGVISAVGVWAALVLDAEAQKARERAKTAPAKTETPKPAPRTPDSTDDGERRFAVVGAPADLSPDAGAPPPPHHSTVEIGASGTLQNSPLTTQDAGVLVGGDVFALLEIVRAFFLRPSIAGAASVGSAASAAYLSTRLDACLRVPGNYTEHRGLLLETCAGVELGAFDHDEGTAAHATEALFSVGPTIGLRGDLASDLSVEVRGLADFDIVHTGGDNIGLLSMRAELGLTWRLR